MTERAPCTSSVLRKTKTDSDGPRPTATEDRFVTRHDFSKEVGLSRHSAAGNLADKFYRCVLDHNSRKRLPELLPTDSSEYPERVLDNCFHPMREPQRKLPLKNKVCN